MVRGVTCGQAQGKLVLSDPCPDCGRDRVLVGYRHNCVPPRRETLNSLAVKVSRGHVALPTGTCQDCVALRGYITEIEAKLVALQKLAGTDCPACVALRETKATAQKRLRARRK